MNRTATIGLRFAALGTLMLALAMVFAPSPSSSNPYLSALSAAALGTSALAKPCHNMACNTTTDLCQSNANTNCAIKGNICARTQPC